eukprot:14374284-Ditylum_brightwellii.AAC.1
MVQLNHLITLPQEHTTIINSENLLDSIQDFSYTAKGNSTHYPEMINSPGFTHDPMTPDTTDTENNEDGKLSPIGFKK